MSKFLLAGLIAAGLLPVTACGPSTREDEGGPGAVQTESALNERTPSCYAQDGKKPADVEAMFAKWSTLVNRWETPSDHRSDGQYSIIRNTATKTVLDVRFSGDLATGVERPYRNLVVTFDKTRPWEGSSPVNPWVLEAKFVAPIDGEAILVDYTRATIYERDRHYDAGHTYGVPGVNIRPPFESTVILGGGEFRRVGNIIVFAGSLGIFQGAHPVTVLFSAQGLTVMGQNAKDPLCSGQQP